MKIAAILFTYNRSWHTKQVLEGLASNTEMPEKLFIFQDGLYKDSDKGEWEQVNTLISQVTFCPVEIFVSEKNKGLAQSIVYGINKVMEEYDAVIVLEDDCVPAVNFISFMRQCFEKYRDNEKVYSVSGYSYPVDLKKGQYDVYGCGRISSWGWGTWKDRWKKFDKDYELVKKMKQRKESAVNLAMWGQGLEDMLIGNVRGTCDSWAVFWALNVIFEEGVCINPYKSLIKNIGLDGSGVHCEIGSRYDVLLSDEGKKKFNLPDNIKISAEVIETFTPLFGSYTAISQKSSSKKNILIYGIGNYFIQNEQTLNEKYNVEAFIDQFKRGWFAGKKIIQMENIKDNVYDLIVIMIQDIQECMYVKEKLIKRGIKREKILIGHDFL